MLYSNLKDYELRNYEKIWKEYNSSYEGMQRNLRGLYNHRTQCLELISEIEKLINSIANSPKHFEAAIQKIHMERRLFCQAEVYGKEAVRTVVKAGINIASGVAGGAAVAAMAPTAAIWAATTFGTASTGTAISALSGAAATKAALAWLGGGALSAGGAGIAGGEALLALAGPIGWGIAGGSTVLSAVAVGVKNKKMAEKAASEGKKIQRENARIRQAMVKIEALNRQTLCQYEGLRKLYERMGKYRNGDFRELKERIKYQLGAMVNNTIGLSELLNRRV